MADAETTARLDRIADKIGEAMHGEGVIDVATVSARMITFALCEAYRDPKDRRERLDVIIEFMIADLERYQGRIMDE